MSVKVGDVEDEAVKVEAVSIIWLEWLVSPPFENFKK